MSPSTRNNLTLLLLAAAVLVMSLSSGTSGGKALITGDTLRVLVIEETLKRTSLPYEQRLALASQKWRTKVTELGGEIKKIEPKQDVSRLPKAWQSAAELDHGESPWWIVSDGRTGKGVSEAFPLTADDAVRTIEEVAQ
ncbi:MAG: hypothetical protein AAGB04_00220 [Pseudomonadota bacterium]